MKKIFCSLVFILFLCVANAQQQDANTLHETAKNFMRTGDYDNALLVLNSALQKAPNDLSILKDQAFVYYLQKDYANAIKTGTSIIARPDADVQSYQVLGLTYQAIAETKEADKMYREGIKRFPSSGVLYNEYGEMLDDENMGSLAIKQWETGIQTDPNYSSNYYDAAKFYDAAGNNLWAILYGEIFINIESLTKRTSEIKELLYNDYKKLYSSAYLPSVLQKGTTFEKAVATVFLKNKNITSLGISPESLTALRTRFILMWDDQYASQFPFRLFDFYRGLLQQGMFEAYNQWVFGAISNSANFDAWMTAHGNDMGTFQHYQQNVLYKTPVGQYYAH